MNNEDSNEMAKVYVSPENKLKELFINYVGDKLKPEDGGVNVEMCVEVLAEEFPEFLMLIAEENFLRGYRQCLKDLENPTSES